MNIRHMTAALLRALIWPRVPATVGPAEDAAGILQSTGFRGGLLVRVGKTNAELDAGLHGQRPGTGAYGSAGA